MNNIESSLTPRLKMIISLIPRCESLCDIGTDHAFVPIYLALNNVADKIIAADVKKGPLLQAENNIMRYNLSEKISTRLSDGFSAFEFGEVETAVAAGMGGETIAHILSCDKGIKTFILQPQSMFLRLRTFLFQNGYKIDSESICEEGRKMYVAMRVTRGNMDKMSRTELEIGPCLIKERPPLFEKYVNYRLHEINCALDKMKGNCSAPRAEEYMYLKNEYERLCK